jgi:hypothetical protein
MLAAVDLQQPEGAFLPQSLGRPAQPWLSFGPYLLMTALVGTCCAVALQLPWDEYSPLLFLPAVLVGAAVATGPGLYAAALAVPVAIFFCMNPGYSIRLESYQVPPLVLYALVCLSITSACAWFRKAAAAAAQQRAAHGARSGVTLPAAAARGGRLDGVDACRGFVLCTIFVNHIPGNLFEPFTHRNFGFSDSAEAFVFLSGVSLALAYGSRFASAGRRAVLVALGRRTVVLYAVHVAVSLAAIAIFTAGAILWQEPSLLTVHGRDLYVDDPDQFFAGILSLGHQLGYFNILPLYIVLIACVPAFLWLAGIDRALMLGVSALIYIASRATGLSLPSWPIEGVWFFNPFAWQLLMALGIAVAPALKNGTLVISRRWLVASALFLAASAFMVTDGFGLRPGLAEAAKRWLDIDKTDLGLVRLGHFLALSCLVYGLGRGGWLRGFALYEALAVIGRHSLLIFALLSLLAAVGQVLIQAPQATLWLDLGLVLGGMVVLYGVARLADVVGAIDRQRAKVRPSYGTAVKA